MEVWATIVCKWFCEQKIYLKKIVAFSMMFLFVISTLLHTGVNLGALPPTGLVLPFLSYGGNALVCTLLSFGWMIHIENSNVK